ncbi:hypothetical protein D3C74_181490 [compost metagenome]
MERRFFVLVRSWSLSESRQTDATDINYSRNSGIKKLEDGISKLTSDDYDRPVKLIMILLRISIHHPKELWKKYPVL